MHNPHVVALGDVCSTQAKRVLVGDNCSSGGGRRGCVKSSLSLLHEYAAALARCPFPALLGVVLLPLLALAALLMISLATVSSVCLVTALLGVVRGRPPVLPITM
jgi:hypothetical protein